MVGRDWEAGTILEEYERVAKGEFRSLLISGLSGIGKTRLIQELQKPIVRHRGYFTSGKFDVYQKNIPYSSLIQALRNLMRTFLTESDERAASWKRNILEAVGQNGRVLTDIIPELVVLIGEQPDVRKLPPVESLNRFHDVFDRFIAALASEENPLTLFIDDLQWCDVASFDFLANIFADCKSHPYLFLLGAFRHNEVDSSHPLTKLIQSVIDAGQPLKEIRLGPLAPEHCHEMVSYILDAPMPQTKALSDFISGLAEGNPLFVSESLAYLHNEELLYLDAERHWRWDLERIRRSRMPTTVVALFSSKIRRLPPELIGLLEYCACLGNTFSPSELAAIRRMTLLQTFETLKPALEQGLLFESKNRLQFIHDKVQEAVLAAIDKERRRGIHREVSGYLLAAVPEGVEFEKIENLFTIVSHLNLGREEHPDAARAYFISDVNYHAGEKALDSLATEAANEYFNLSRELLPVGCWEDGRYERTFRIHQKTAKTELMCGNYARSEKLLNELLDHAKTDLDKAECLAEQTTSLSSIGNFIKAIETANRGLAYFGKAIPEDPAEADKRRHALMAEIDAKKIDGWETILNMPFTTDRKSKIELAFYSELIPDLYMSGLVPQLYLSAAQSTQHCLAGGMDESVIYSFSIMGLQLGEEEKFLPAFKYEDLARDLSAKYPNTFGATRGMNGIVWCNMHSRSHPVEIAEYALKGIQCGKNCGDLYNAGLCYGPLMWNLQVQGADLALIEEYAAECLQFSKRYHLSFSVGLAEAMQAGWIEPMKRANAPPIPEETLKRWEEDNHVASAGCYFVHRALAHYYFGEHDEADACLARVRMYLHGLTDNVLKRQWHVFRVLNALKRFAQGAGFADEAALMEEIRPLIEKVETWASLGPLLKPYLAFLYAELARVKGDFREARALYLDAIEAAHGQNYTFLEGHLHECLAELLVQAGHTSAGVYFAEAARLYRKCRAQRKEIDLVEGRPEFFEAEKKAYPRFEAEPEAPTLPNLDVDYLMKSAFAISAEMDQITLMKRIMQVVIESSGAQDGYLLIEEKGALFVRAESHVAEKQTPRTMNQRLEEVQDICKAVVRYVHRTGEKLIFNNASTECTLRGSPDCLDMHLRSLLCLPVMKQSKRIGILYLENLLLESAFTAEKTQMTELLTSQAAISFENARLVDKMKETERNLVDSLRREQFLANLVRNASVAMAIGYPDGRLGTHNPAFQKLTGYSEEELNDVTWNIALTPPEWREGEKEKLAEIHRTGSSVQYEKEYIRKDGSRLAVGLLVHPFFDDAGRVSHYYAFISDITERKKAEEQIKNSLAEKEVLLREVHHRVKNNLQIVSSLLNLQMPYVKDSRAIELFKESQNRVISMALIHEKLYQTESLARIDVSEYIDTLVATLLRSYGVTDGTVRTEIAARNMDLDIDTVIPCALIINELVSNALKYAFPDAWRHDGRTGELRIGLKQDADRRFVLTVTDNGIGLPVGFDVGRCESLGLKLVVVLVKQLRGDLRLGTREEGGAGFTISFETPK
jgi:PAS domain S-box-containing protein